MEKYNFSELVNVYNKSYLGRYLIDLYGDHNFENELYLKADLIAKQLFVNDSSKPDPILIAALVYIGLKYYDSNFYDHVYEKFEYCSKAFSKKLFENKLRETIKRFTGLSEEIRYVTLLLAHSFVPVNYLGSFFELMFDIYKINYNYEINFDLEPKYIENDIGRILLHIFSGVGPSSSDTLSIDVDSEHKEYLVTRGTQLALQKTIVYETSLDICYEILKIIDSDYWGKKHHEQIENEYLKLGYNAWKNSKKSKNNTKNAYVFLKTPTIKRLNNNNKVELSIPFVDFETYDENTEIEMHIYSEGKLIRKYDKSTGIFTVRSIFGGFRLFCKDIELENPLNRIKYKIFANNKIIYETKESIQSDYLIFDINRQALTRNRNY